MTYPEQTTFISEDFFQKMSPLKEAVDPNLFWPAMYVAQDKRLRPYLGDSLYAKLKADIPSPAGVYLTLMQDYVVYVVVWATLMELLPNLQYQYVNGTLSQRTSEDAQPVPDEVMKDMIERTQQNLDMYTSRMVDYLCGNSSLYVEYTNNTGTQRCPIRYKPASSYLISDSRSMTGNNYCKSWWI